MPAESGRRRRSARTGESIPTAMQAGTTVRKREPQGIGRLAAAFEEYQKGAMMLWEFDHATHILRGGTRMEMVAAVADTVASRPRSVSGGRFGWVIEGRGFGPDPVFDVDLARFASAAVIPTRGALIPEWVMLVPRSPCLSISELDPSARRTLMGYAEKTNRLVAERTGNAVLLEHGAATVGSVNGCGVDQAHLHVVGLQPEFVQWVIQNSPTENWSRVECGDPWTQVLPNKDYLLLWGSDQSWVTVVEHPTSQFFRKKIAEFLGRPDEWDYRRYPHVAEARRTVELFRRYHPAT
jgi:ATP adenylyltransferase